MVFIQNIGPHRCLFVYLPDMCSKRGDPHVYTCVNYGTEPEPSFQYKLGTVIEYTHAAGRRGSIVRSGSHRSRERERERVRERERERERESPVSGRYGVEKWRIFTSGN